MKNKLFLATLAAAVTVPAMVVPIQAEAATKKFKDVPGSYYAHMEIMNLVDRGVINGFSDGTFKPTKQVTRAEFAAFVARALELPAATSSFKDVPKTSALYDGVSRANKAGIIKGFSNGTFKPNTPVNRQDMAVMLDRALQLKGPYTKTKTLDFTDTAKVGAYAKTSVERMYAYNVMGAYLSKNFAGTTIGTRAETAKAIYNMLKVVEGGTVSVPLPTPPTSGLTVEQIKKKDPLTLTHAEIVKAYGPYVITRRFDLFNQIRGIQEWDIWSDVYMNYLKNAREYNYPVVLRPDEWLKQEKDEEFGLLANLFGEVDTSYPNYEVIAVNGKPFSKTDLMFGNNLKNYNRFIQTERGGLLPKPPADRDQFKIDLHYKKHDFVTYKEMSVNVGKQTILPYVKENKALMVDVSSIFANTPYVNVSSDKISYKNNWISFTNDSRSIVVNGQSETLSVLPEMKNGKQMLPIREVANHLGLTTRVSKGYFDKIEIQNYEEDLYEIFK